MICTVRDIILAVGANMVIACSSYFGREFTISFHSAFFFLNKSIEIKGMHQILVPLVLMQLNLGFDTETLKFMVML